MLKRDKTCFSLLPLESLLLVWFIFRATSGREDMIATTFNFKESFRITPVCGGTKIRPLHKLNPVRSFIQSVNV